MAPTIIRVKRKLDDTHEIDSKIVLNCKKQKINDKDVYSQFSFVGTVDEKEDVIPDHILKLSKKDAENIIQSKCKDTNGGLNSRLTENLEKAKEKRFKIVNFMRNSDNCSESSQEQIILDVEKELENQETSSGSINDPKESFVYDIYVAQEDFSTVLQTDLIDVNDLSILDYNDYLYSCPRLTNDVEDELHDDYDEDSNDENYYKNDYPDEESPSGSSVDERAMRRAMQNFDIQNDLSSDEEYQSYENYNDRFAYSIDTEEYGFEDDYDYACVGSSHKKYMKRVMRNMEENDSENSTDSNDE